MDKLNAFMMEDIEDEDLKDSRYFIGLELIDDLVVSLANEIESVIDKENVEEEGIGFNKLRQSSASPNVATLSTSSTSVDKKTPITNDDGEDVLGDDNLEGFDDMETYPTPSLLPPMGSACKMPIFILSHHHHIIQFVHVDPAHLPPRPATNVLSNSDSDVSHHHHISHHVHHLHKCHLHIPPVHRKDIYWEPHVRMRSTTLGTFSSFSLQDTGIPNKTTGKKKCLRQEAKVSFVQLSHHFIHLHEVFCKDLCCSPPWLSKDHECRLLHLQNKRPDFQGFFQANVTVQTITHSATQCKRWGETNLAKFEHFHSHYHTLHINATKDSPLYQSPHALYTDFMISKELSHAQKPISPYST